MANKIRQLNNQIKENLLTTNMDIISLHWLLPICWAYAPSAMPSNSCLCESCVGFGNHTTIRWKFPETCLNTSACFFHSSFEKWIPILKSPSFPLLHSIPSLLFSPLRKSEVETRLRCRQMRSNSHQSSKCQQRRRPRSKVSLLHSPEYSAATILTAKKCEPISINSFRWKLWKFLSKKSLFYKRVVLQISQHLEIVPTPICEGSTQH